MASDDKSRRNTIAIYDFRNKYISFSGQLISVKIVAVAQDGGTVYLLTSSQMLLRYRERDMASKIDVLIKKSLYPLAISLMTEEQSDISEIMKLVTMYGDHLYKKGEFDSAMTQYITTIGYLPTSYVIRRYLDPHRIFNLIAYLEKLLERSYATKDHLTLLLTCYAKIKEDAKIQTFLQNTSIHQIPVHELETRVDILTSSGYVGKFVSVLWMSVDYLIMSCTQISLCSWLRCVHYMTVICACR